MLRVGFIFALTLAAMETAQAETAMASDPCLAAPTIACVVDAAMPDLIQSLSGLDDQVEVSRRLARATDDLIKLGRLSDARRTIASIPPGWDRDDEIKGLAKAEFMSRVDPAHPSALDTTVIDQLADPRSDLGRLARPKNRADFVADVYVSTGWALLRRVAGADASMHVIRDAPVPMSPSALRTWRRFVDRFAQAVGRASPTKTSREGFWLARFQLNAGDRDAAVLTLRNLLPSKYVFPEEIALWEALGLNESEMLRGASLPSSTDVWDQTYFDAYTAITAGDRDAAVAAIARSATMLTGGAVSPLSLRFRELCRLAATLSAADGSACAQKALSAARSALLASPVGPYAEGGLLETAALFNDLGEASAAVATVREFLADYGQDHLLPGQSSDEPRARQTEPPRPGSLALAARELARAGNTSDASTLLRAAIVRQKAKEQEIAALPNLSVRDVAARLRTFRSALVTSGMAADKADAVLASMANQDRMPNKPHASEIAGAWSYERLNMRDGRPSDGIYLLPELALLDPYDRAFVRMRRAELDIRSARPEQARPLLALAMQELGQVPEAYDDLCQAANLAHQIGDDTLPQVGFRTSIAEASLDPPAFREAALIHVAACFMPALK